jgi:hypothetical protein
MELGTAPRIVANGLGGNEQQKVKKVEEEE